MPGGGTTGTPPPPVPFLDRATPAIPAGDAVYVTVQGDWWDLIALKVYGMQRGNEHLMYRLLEENYNLRNIVQFSGGIKVAVPPADVTTVIPLVPWKTATIGGVAA